MRPSRLFRIYVLEILFLSLVWNSPPQPSLGANATSQGNQINQLLSEAAKLTGATNRDIVSDWLRALVEIGREGEAFAWARQITDPNIQSQALRTMAETLLRAGARDEAWRAAEAAHAAARRIERIKDANDIEVRSRGRSDELRKLAEILGQHGEVEYARQLAAEAFTSALEMGDVDEDTRFSNLRQAVLQLARLGQPDEAIAALRRIEEPSFRAHATYSALGELIVAGAFERAMQEFRAVADDRRRFGVLQNTVGWLLKNGKEDEALKVARAAENRGEQVGLMSFAAESLHQAGQSEQARHILDEAILAARQISDQEERADALAGAAGALARSDRLTEARKLFAESFNLTNGQVSLGGQAYARGAIFEKLLAAGQGEEALELARLCDDSYERAQDLCGVVESSIKAKQPKKARQVVAETLGAIQEIEDEGLRLEPLQRLIAALAQSTLTPELKQAKRAAASALLKFDRASANTHTFWDTPQSLALAGQASEAIRSANQAPDPQARVAALLYAARGATKAGHSEVAEKLLAAALDNVRQINATETFMLRQLYLRSVIEALLENHQVDEALQLTRAEALEPYRQDGLRFVADYFVKSSRAADRIDRWLNILDEIEDERSRSAALLSGLEAMIQTGRLDGWLTMANAIEDHYERANLLRSTVEQLVKSNLRTEARQTAQTALGVLRQITPDYATSRHCADFAIQLAAWREPDLAIEAAHLCADADHKLAAFTAILRMYK